MNKKKVGRVTLNVSTLGLALCATLSVTLEKNKAMVNQALGTKTERIVTDDNGTLFSTFTPDYQNTTDLVKAHADLGERAEEEGAVLLKNKNNALPLSKDNKITLMGLRSSSTFNVGTTNPAGGALVSASPADLLEAKGLKINKTVATAYDEVSAMDGYKTPSGWGAKGPKVNGIETSFTPVSKEWVKEKGVDTINEPTIEELKSLSSVGSSFDDSVREYHDVGLITLGRSWAEAGDYFPGEKGVDTSTGARNILALNDDERALVSYAKEKFDKVVILLHTTHPMEIQELEDDDKIGAILWIGEPGKYGWSGIADVLDGEVSPSGHLPDTFASDTVSSPSMQNFGVHNFSDPEKLTKSYMNADSSLTQKDNTASDTFVVEAEGIYVGYKYYETRYEDTVLKQGNASSAAGTFDSKAGWNYDEEVTYPFGYGLSYTTFDERITDFKWAKDNKSATIKVSVTNTGSANGKDSVQIYAQSPYTDYDKKNGVEKSSVNLLNYAKTKELKPNESETLEIPLDFQYLASYDSKGAGTYILDSGDYYFAIGNGSHEALNNILASKGKSTSDGMDVNGDKEKAVKYTYKPSGEVDDYTFALSKANVKVENQFDEADWNNIKPEKAEKVTYLSRRDWEATWPKEYDNLLIDSKIAKLLNNDTYEIKTSDQPLTWNSTATSYTLADMKGADYEDDRWTSLLNQIDFQEALNFISKGNRLYQSLTGAGFASATLTENGPSGFTAKLSQFSPEGAPWQVKKEDPYASYTTNDLCSADVIAASFNHDLASEIGTLWGNDSLFNGLPILWAPSLNLHRTDYNGRNGEYFSEDPILSGYIVAKEASAAEKKGLIVAMKHFAFNDQESCRDGIAIFMTEQKIRETELRGFQIAIEEGGVKALMTSYSRIGLTWNGANIHLMQNVLRGEWNYHGYAVSDMDILPSYMTLKEGVIAGTTNYDMLGNSFIYTGSAGNYATETSNTLMGDATFQQAVKDRVHETLWTIAQSNYMNSVSTTSHSVFVWNSWRIAYLVGFIVFGVVALGGVVLYVFGLVKDRN